MTCDVEGWFDQTLEERRSISHGDGEEVTHAASASGGFVPHARGSFVM